jgi:hypothetical protein
MAQSSLSFISGGLGGPDAKKNKYKTGGVFFAGFKQRIYQQLLHGYKMYFIRTGRI